MGIFFTNGETKKRPGVYQRYVNAGTPKIAGASDGIVAVTVRSNWGALGKVEALYTPDDIFLKYGDGGKNGTVSLIRRIFDGGAKQVYVARLGTEATKGELTLKDAGETSVPAIICTAKHAGDRDFTVGIRQTLSDETSKEFVVYENSILVETIKFDADKQTEVDLFIEAGKKSKFFDFKKVTGYVATPQIVSGLPAEAFPKGTNPTVTTDDYSKAFALLEPFTWNVIALDVESDTGGIQSLLANYVDRIYQSGKMCMGVIGEPVTEDYERRLANARSFNDYKVVYCGGGYVDTTGNLIDGMKAAATLAGMVAAIPSSKSLTHRVIQGATEVSEHLTDIQYEQAIDNGMIVFSTASNGSVWIESGINTLVTPNDEDDEGWKKIKRAKVRFELMTRVSATVEPLIGNVNNNPDGRAVVLQAIQGVLNIMSAEEKILPGATVEIDPGNPPVGDSAWFIIGADDVDSLEKIYFVYKFRYAAI